MHQERPKVGIGVIVIQNNQVLLGKRKNSHGSGDWAFPGGHLEFGETPEACTCRELLEETGLQANQIIAGPWTNDIFDHNKHYITLFMFVTEFIGTPQVLEPLKCEVWQWFEWDHLPEPLFAPVKSFIKNMRIENLVDVERRNRLLNSIN